MVMDNHAEARIELDAITGNVAALREHVAPSAVMAVVKAGGYGHGAVAAARAALRGGAQWLGVVHVAEALELRAAGVEGPLLCLMAIGEHAHADAIAADVDVSAGSVGMVRRLAAAAARAGRPARVHLKADTGMGRGGATAADPHQVIVRRWHPDRGGRVRDVPYFGGNPGLLRDGQRLTECGQLRRDGRVARLVGRGEMRPQSDDADAAGGLRR